MTPKPDQGLTPNPDRTPAYSGHELTLQVWLFVGFICEVYVLFLFTNYYNLVAK
ncbi:hypothetical protein P20652_0001 [Pseudoalteromonas sp. BSi20652]|nr:hypothetical protein P20652_0001 [Pseudoalteromonas sp. BSi20652]